MMVSSEWFSQKASPVLKQKFINIVVERRWEVGGVSFVLQICLSPHKNLKIESLCSNNVLSLIFLLI